MSTEHLADYLINNDFEMQIQSREYSVISERLSSDGIVVSARQIVEAVRIAANDPYIQMIESQLSLKRMFV